ncbi:ECF transporter S component [Hydrogenoanaerobacterium sp.]|uniref:ECF transporter S component n=1 Tax=Hydrogenoanaerobacterium sp. TaxID=2953763 RepID=UPI00289C68B5|nr:ECF transporter S component [Hydrogenoanaerobacterium sp.]
MSEKKKYSFQSDFSMLALLLIPIAVAVNFVGGQLAVALKIPLYLDCIGTILVAMLCGPWVGGLAGLVTNLVLGISNPTFFIFAIVNVSVGIVTGFCARWNGFSVWWKWLISMFLMAITSLIIAAPIVVLAFGGVTASGTSLITATLMATGSNIWKAVFSTELVFTVTDRIISFVITYLIIRVIPARTLIKFSCGEHYIKKAKESKVG